MKILFFALFVVIITSCDHPLLDYNVDNYKHKSEIITVKPLDPNQIKEMMSRIEVLKNSFIYNKDDFDTIGWYLHKNQTIDNITNRNCLRAHVKGTGYIYLEDHYFSTEWLFHTSLQISINGKVWTSETIETYDKNNKQTNNSGFIWEMIDYIGGRDNGILKAIADNGEAEIKVRFNGRQRNEDFILSDTDKKAIKDSYELSELINKVGNH